MKNYLASLIKYIYKLEGKIAFYPTFYSVIGLAISFLTYGAENLGVSEYLYKNIPQLIINSTDTALNILTTFIAGLISIMVFSFSMVMVLLNQASSNFSPRVLPGLISNKRHQKILGIYNATLLYCIFTLVQIEPNQDKFQLPGFSVLLAIGFMTVCLGAFIYFIHSISEEIQVNNIILNIYKKAKSRLEKLIDSEKTNNLNFPDSEQWNCYNTKTSGYLQDIVLGVLLDFAKAHNCKFEVLPIKGNFVLEDEILFKCNKKLNEEELKKVYSLFNFSSSQRIEENYVLAFKQMTEIAVKCMSPGINDPGTALICIDYLTQLFNIRLSKKDQIILSQDDMGCVKINSVSFKSLLYSVITPIRTYSKHDIVIVLKLFSMLEYVYLNSKNEVYSKAIKEEANSLYKDAKQVIKNETDLSKLETAFLKF